MWEFSLTSFLIGLLIFAGGGATVVFYRQIAENVAHGVSSYDKTKLFGLIFIGIGFLVMTNLHVTLLTLLIKSIFPGL